MYFNLFALLRDSDGTWFPPSHVFEASQSACESLQFRLRWVCCTCAAPPSESAFCSLAFCSFSLFSRLLFRFYFPGWHNSSRLLSPHRYGPSKGTESPVLDDCVMAYLFSQVGLVWSTPPRENPAHPAPLPPHPPLVAQRLPE